MNTTGRIAAIGACAALFAGCGGGGGGSSPQTAIPKAVPSPTSSPIGSATLSIKFPANFHIAKLGAKSSSTARKPAYVNPSTGDTLTVYLDGTATYTHQIVGATQATQTITLPIFSMSSHTIVSVETDGDNILSLGETDLSAGAIAPGAPVAIGLTMLMNVDNIGLMTSPTDANNDASTDYDFTSNHGQVCSAPGSMTIYPFAADPDGGFVSGSDAGAGVTVPSLVSWTNADAATSGDSVAPIGGTPAYGSTINFANISDGQGPYLNYQVLNPVYAITSDLGDYPGIAALFNNSTISENSLNTQDIYYTQFQLEPYCNT